MTCTSYADRRSLRFFTERTLCETSLEPHICFTGTPTITSRPLESIIIIVHGGVHTSTPRLLGKSILLRRLPALLYCDARLRHRPTTWNRY